MVTCPPRTVPDREADCDPGHLIEEHNVLIFLPVEMDLGDVSDEIINEILGDI